MAAVKLDSLRFDAQRYTTIYQQLLTLPRETLPQLTAEAARAALRRAGDELSLELIETEGVAPCFSLLPDGPPTALLFGTWHGESLPVAPAAVEGAERLALAASLAAAGAIAAAGVGLRVAVVAAAAATNGSLVLMELLERHRDRLSAPVAFWARIGPGALERRRIFLGARGRVVLGLRGEGAAAANSFRIRDAVVRALSDEAYGPRPLDFELLRKIAMTPGAMEFLERTIQDAGSVAGEGELRLRNALFEPRGQVFEPPVKHPDRPAAWLVFETAENMGAADIRSRVEAAAPGVRVDVAEAFPWDRTGIHHPGAQAAIREAKAVSAGAEIWPAAPWPTPSGALTRTLGTPLVEWAVPLPEGGMIRSPKPGIFEAIQREIAALTLRGAGLLDTSEA